jgi:uncharacterized membrane protein YgcG
MRRLRLLAGPLVLAACALPTLASRAATTPTLTFGPNVTAYTGDYGEPGIAIHEQNVYVTTPGDGGAVWGVSRNGGTTFAKKPTVKPPPGQNQGVLSGSDSDVAVGTDGTVYVGDLTIDGIEVSRSNDGGTTFPQQVFVNTDAAADREWLAVDGVGDEAIVYVAWHELATGTMFVKRSVDGGKTFDNVPHLLYSNPQTGGESAHNGTSIGQVSTDGRGHVYVSYGVTRLDTPPGSAVTPFISKIIVAVSADYGVTWKDVVVNPGYTDANYGNFWMATAVDKSGIVYATYSGRDHDATDPMRVYLQASVDNGDTWTEPFVVSPEGGNALFGWVAGGGPGVAVVAWYHTDAEDKNLPAIEWHTQVAQVRGLVATPPPGAAFAVAPGVTQTGVPVVYRGTASDHVMHTGGICTFGILCGVVPNTSDDRSLLDFFKVTVAPDGMAAVVFSDNGDSRQDVTYAKQVGGPSAFPPPATGGTGGDTGGTGGAGGAGGGGSGGGGGAGGGGGLPATGLDLAALAGAAGALLVTAAVLRRRTARG